jgi:hypothetical protein
MAASLTFFLWWQFSAFAHKYSVLLGITTGEKPLSYVLEAEFASPVASANKMIFVEQGDLTSAQLVIYAKPGKQDPVYVGYIAESEIGDQYFSGQWSKDGQIFVCSANGRQPGVQLVRQVGYDFTTRRALLPITEKDRLPNASDWNSFEATLQQLLSAHGGLAQNHIDIGILRDHGHPLYFWRMPTMAPPNSKIPQ